MFCQVQRNQPLARRPFAGRADRMRSRAGVTLLEVVFGFGILVVAILFTIGFLMQQVSRNRQIAMEVAGMQAANHIIGQLEDLAVTAPSGKTIAYAIVRHYKDLSSETVPLGPGRSNVPRVEDDNARGSLLCRFYVPVPGQSRYLESDSRFVPNYCAVGEMRIYLDEAYLNSYVLPNLSWSDLSDTPSTISGMDIDLDGNLTGNFLSTYDNVKQLAINITVKFYTDETHKTLAYVYERNILSSKIRDATEGFIPPSSGG